MSALTPVGAPDPPTEPVPSARSVPQVTEGLVPRPDLVARIERGVERGVVVVSGPAGAGKTLLLASWAGQRRSAPAWLNIEPEDAEPEHLWARVLHALQSSPAVPAESRLGTMKPPPTFQPRSVTTLVNASQEIGEPVVLVLEDLHLVAGTASMTTLASAARRGLGNLRLVIASRTEPVLPLTRLRLAGHLTEINGDDLAFGAQETTQLLAQYELALTPGQVESVLARTEGWAAGIRLVALALASADDMTAELDQIAGDHRSVADYFVEEVLDHVAPDRVDFLLATCLPRRVCADLALALTGRTDAQRLLDELERDQLFVVALDRRRQWYRYHHLFGDLLRHRLQSESPERIRELHLTAARWFAEHDEAIEACRHLAEAGAWQELSRLVIRSAGAHMLGVHRHALVEVLRHLPAELVLDDVELATAAAVCSYAEYDANATRAHVARARTMLDQLHGLDAEIIEAVLVTLDAIAAWLESDPEAERLSAATAVALLDRLPPAAIPSLNAYRTGARVVLGMGTLWTGHFDEADHVLSGALQALHGLEDDVPVLAVHTHGHLAVLRAFQGRMHEARSRVQAALGFAERSGWLFLPQTGPALLALAVVELFEAENEQCAVTLERCRVSLGSLDDRVTLAGVSLLQARLELSAGSTIAAASTIEQVRRRSTDWRMPWFLERWCELVELEISLTESPDNRRDELLRLLESSWGPARPEGQRVVLVARAHLAENRPDEALRLLASVTDDPRADLVPATEGWALTALAHDQLRQDSEAISALERALAVAEPQRIVRPFVAAGGRMEALLERQRRLGSPHRAFADLLLARFAGAHAEAEPQLLEELTPRERSVLQLVPTMMSNAEIADELFVSVNTVKVHLKSLYRKLGATNRRQAVARARALGLVDPLVHR